MFGKWGSEGREEGLYLVRRMGQGKRRRGCIWLGKKGKGKKGRGCCWLSKWDRRRGGAASGTGEWGREGLYLIWKIRQGRGEGAVFGLADGAGRGYIWFGKWGRGDGGIVFGLANGAGEMGDCIYLENGAGKGELYLVWKMEQESGGGAVFGLANVAGRGEEGLFGLENGTAEIRAVFFGLEKEQERGEGRCLVWQTGEGGEGLYLAWQMRQGKGGGAVFGLANGTGERGRLGVIFLSAGVETIPAGIYAPLDYQAYI